MTALRRVHLSYGNLRLQSSLRGRQLALAANLHLTPSYSQSATRDLRCLLQPDLENRNLTPSCSQSATRDLHRLLQPNLKNWLLALTVSRPCPRRHPRATHVLHNLPQSDLKDRNSTLTNSPHLMGSPCLHRRLLATRVLRLLLQALMTSLHLVDKLHSRHCRSAICVLRFLLKLVPMTNLHLKDSLFPRHYSSITRVLRRLLQMASTFSLHRTGCL